MFLGASGLKPSVLAILILLLVAVSLVLVSCGNDYSYTNTGAPTPSTLTFRAFISNPLFPSGSSSTPVLNVVDALDDIAFNAISVGATSPAPGLMVVFPNKRFTIVFSSTNNTITLVNNSTSSVAQSSGGTSSSITLPGFSESMVVAPDNANGFAAVATAPVTGQSPGVVDALNYASSAITAAIPVAGARYLVQSHNGNRLLVFGSRPDTVTVLSPSSIGTSTDPRTDVQSSAFDHPVWGAFSSDDSTAYILNCGPECGGTTASITMLDMNSNLPGPTIPVDAGTTGLLSGNTLYIAGTKPGANTCAGSANPTLATTCGEVSVVDLGTMTVSATATITDGYHTRMELGSNKRLFVGARTCTNINAPSSSGNPGEVRGCLSIFNTNTLNVVIPPVLGDATGIQPISRRDVVYVVQNGNLYIYNTTTDKLQTTQVDIIGQAIDVKQVD